jgi:hypothetical protein
MEIKMRRLLTEEERALLYSAGQGLAYPFGEAVRQDARDEAEGPDEPIVVTSR